MKIIFASYSFSFSLFSLFLSVVASVKSMLVRFYVLFMSANSYSPSFKLLKVVIPHFKYGFYYSKNLMLFTTITAAPTCTWKPLYNVKSAKLFTANSTSKIGILLFASSKLGQLSKIPWQALKLLYLICTARFWISLKNHSIQMFQNTILVNI